LDGNWKLILAQLVERIHLRIFGKHSDQFFGQARREFSKQVSKALFRHWHTKGGLGWTNAEEPSGGHFSVIDSNLAPFNLPKTVAPAEIEKLLEAAPAAVLK
jgi:hypothetical protein